MASANNTQLIKCSLICHFDEDDRMSVRLWEFTKRRLSEWGYLNVYTYGADAIPGRSVFAELSHEPQLVITLITRKLLDDNWTTFTYSSVFKKMIEESSRPDQIASHRFIPILIGVRPHELPTQLRVLSFLQINDWERDENEWQKLKRALDLHRASFDEMPQGNSGRYQPEQEGAQNANYNVPSSSDVAPPIAGGETAQSYQARYLGTSGDRDMRPTVFSPNSSQPTNSVSVTHHDSFEQSSTQNESGNYNWPLMYKCVLSFSMGI